MTRTEVARSRVAAGCGLLLVVFALALSLPGVRAVRAGEADMTPVGPDDFAGAPAATRPEACGDDAAGADAQPTRAQVVALIPQPPAGAGAAPGEGFVVLNSRGYNYGEAQAVDADAQRRLLEREIEAIPSR